MKTTVALGIALLLAAGLSCSRGQPQESPSQPKQLARRLYLAWSEHDLDEIAAIFAPDGTYEDVPPARSYRGPEEIKGFLTAIWSWAPNVQFEVTSLAVAGDTVVAEWVMSGTQTGAIGQIPAIGNDFSVRGVSVMEIEGGRITRNSDYYDLSSLLVQFGVRYAAPPPSHEE